MKFVQREDGHCHDFPRPADVIHNRYDQGSVCIAAYKDDTFVGFIWLQIGPYTEDDVRCRYIPSPNAITAWDYDLYIDPKFRSSIAFIKLWSSAIEYLQSHGVTWSLSRISAFSPESLAAHRRLGAVPIGTALFLDVMGTQITVSTVSPFLHLARRNRPGPDLGLHAPEQ